MNYEQRKLGLSVLSTNRRQFFGGTGYKSANESGYPDFREAVAPRTNVLRVHCDHRLELAEKPYNIEIEAPECGSFVEVALPSCIFESDFVELEKDWEADHYLIDDIENRQWDAVEEALACIDWRDDYVHLFSDDPDDQELIGEVEKSIYLIREKHRSREDIVDAMVKYWWGKQGWALLGIKTFIDQWHTELAYTEEQYQLATGGLKSGQITEVPPVELKALRIENFKDWRQGRRPMNLRFNLLNLAQDHADATGRSLVTIGNLSAGNPALYTRLAGGGSCSLNTYTKAVQWFSDNLPPGVLWPPGIKRPKPARDSQAARSRKRPYLDRHGKLVVGKGVDALMTREALADWEGGMGTRDAMLSTLRMTIHRYQDAGPMGDRQPNRQSKAWRCFVFVCQSGDVRFKRQAAALAAELSKSRRVMRRVLK